MRDLFLRENRTAETAVLLKQKAIDGAQLLLTQTLPHASTRLSELLSPRLTPPELLAGMKDAENAIYTDTSNPLLTLSEEPLKAMFAENGWQITHCDEYPTAGFRFIPKERIEAWFASDGIYGSRLEPETAAALKQICLNQIAGKNHPWQKKLVAFLMKAL